MSRTPARFTQADAARALKAAKQAGAGERTFIYFVRSGEFVKIGQSARWKVRLDQMQTGSPYTLVPMLVLIGEPTLEKKLHNRFRASHFRGEWFHMSPAIGAFIKENLKNCVAKSADEPDLRRPEEDIVL
jgi:hypothetical protein